ncbi:tRNA 2-selenouridine synthase-like [Babylonia areolata]|uniref:tRNA 2-selenouridine synthase-like n=1 Tax=Babylonia areolata TaxID=304850 RepID=UPI003FD62405
MNYENCPSYYFQVKTAGWRGQFGMWTQTHAALVGHLPVPHTVARGVGRTWRLCRRGLITKTTDSFHPQATEVIDARAPLEFDNDHIPGALNFPVLTNEQRSQVGRTYNQDNFQARKVGAAMVTRNISDHIATYFVHKPAQYCPLIYCWRGGQRSHSLAVVLSQIGFEVLVLEGGYQTYRRTVIRDLHSLAPQFKYIVLTGLTGCGKTLLLHSLRQQGAQVLDLEGVAQHRGSLLGLWHQHTQPSQKLWESQLRHSLAAFDPALPVFMESESSRVGRVNVPPALFRAMQEADRVEVCLPLEQRVKHILQEYPHWTEDVSALRDILLPLRKVRGQAMLDAWFRLAEEEQWEEFVEQLLVQHYDLTYRVSQKKNDWSQRKRTVTLEDLSERSQLKFVESVIDMGKGQVCH